ncbi:MAG: T9SS type A sorting domain-containing protein, partial [Bacteroidales bacterium]|nr:T9SS type A sorting domain-containing protein [Bacteroidales bacterium]
MEDVVVEDRNQTILDVSLQRVGKFFVSPNPYRDYLDIVLDNTGNSDRISVRIVSLTGKIILEKEMQAGLNYPVRLSVEDIASGMYLLEVKTGTIT